MKEAQQERGDFPEARFSFPARGSELSVERWRRQRREQGEEGVRSTPRRPRFSANHIAQVELELERELERGRPLAHGCADQRWTLAWGRL